jgi:hypothetical protein
MKIKNKFLLLINLLNFNSSTEITKMNTSQENSLPKIENSLSSKTKYFVGIISLIGISGLIYSIFSKKTSEKGSGEPAKVSKTEKEEVLALLKKGKNTHSDKQLEDVIRIIESFPINKKITNEEDIKKLTKYLAFLDEKSIIENMNLDPKRKNEINQNCEKIKKLFNSYGVNINEKVSDKEKVTESEKEEVIDFLEIDIKPFIKDPMKIDDNQDDNKSDVLKIIKESPINTKITNEEYISKLKEFVVHVNRSIEDKIDNNISLDSEMTNQVNKMYKKIEKLFNSYGLNITIKEI